MPFTDIVTTNALVWKSFLAIGILIIGIAIGRGISYLLTLFFQKIDLDKKVRHSFWELIVTLIRWSIYIIFFNLALSQLSLPGLTKMITNALLTIPSFVGAIVIVAFGFSVGTYLKEILSEAQTPGWKFLSNYLFYFVIFVSGIYAFRIALFSINDLVLNYLTIIISSVFAIASAYHLVTKKD